MVFTPVERRFWQWQFYCAMCLNGKRKAETERGMNEMPNPYKPVEIPHFQDRMTITSKEREKNKSSRT